MRSLNRRRMPQIMASLARTYARRRAIREHAKALEEREDFYLLSPQEIEQAKSDLDFTGTPIAKRKQGGPRKQKRR